MNQFAPIENLTEDEEDRFDELTVSCKFQLKNAAANVAGCELDDAERRVKRALLIIKDMKSIRSAAEKRSK